MVSVLTRNIFPYFTVHCRNLSNIRLFTWNLRRPQSYLIQTNSNEICHPFLSCLLFHFQVTESGPLFCVAFGASCIIVLGMVSEETFFQAYVHLQKKNLAHFHWFCWVCLEATENDYHLCFLSFSYNLCTFAWLIFIICSCMKVME